MTYCNETKHEKSAIVLNKRIMRTTSHEILITFFYSIHLIE